MFGATAGPDAQALINAVNANPNIQITINNITVPNRRSQIFDPQTRTWSSAGDTQVELANFVSSEIGPALLRPDGTVLATSGDTGVSAIYDYQSNSWVQGPTLPVVPEGQLTMADGPIALLPNGNALLAAGPGLFMPPTYMFEFDGHQYIPAPRPSMASTASAWRYQMMVLPTGQILAVNGSDDVEIYNPGDRHYDPNWAPLLKNYPSEVIRGNSYKITGVRFNGMSQGAGYGDDYQGATNYPLVRITNKSTHHVRYCRTHDHSFMGVASDKSVSTYMDIPTDIEKGASIIEVIANGIPSPALNILVK